jgi:peptide deformylase
VDKAPKENFGGVEMLQFLAGDDPRLRRTTQKIGRKVTKAQQKTISKVRKMLEASPGAMAIAAPQVGIDLRFFVVRRTATETMVVIDPKVVWTSLDEAEDFFVDTQGNPVARQASQWEGCLSFPGMEFLIVRPQIIRIEFMNEKGTMKCASLSGFDARVFLHETDHLDGVMIDRKCEASRKIEDEEEDRMAM